MTIEEYNELERVAKIVRPTPQDISSIWDLYVKFVDSTAPYPNNSGCSTCGNSVVKYWRNLMNWWNQNKQYHQV
jgi:hypothetical protein